MRECEGKTLNQYEVRYEGRRVRRYGASVKRDCGVRERRGYEDTRIRGYEDTRIRG